MSLFFLGRALPKKKGNKKVELFLLRTLQFYVLHMNEYSNFSKLHQEA
jgi:hypothetical protein